MRNAETNANRENIVQYLRVFYFYMNKKPFLIFKILEKNLNWYIKINKIRHSLARMIYPQKRTILNFQSKKYPQQAKPKIDSTSS